MTFDETFEAMVRAEERLAASYDEDCATELELVDAASALLLTILLRVGPRTGSLEHNADTGELSGDLDTLLLTTQLYMGVRAFRTIRAARRSLTFGYERESLALDRIVVELNAHRKAILDDKTGQEALAWLEGERRSGVTKRVKQLGPADLYGNLSTDSHGDPAPVERLFDPKTGAIQLEPRRGIPTRASLLMHAGMARDQAVVLAQLAGIDLQGVDELDGRIKAANRALSEEAAAT